MLVSYHITMLSERRSLTWCTNVRWLSTQQHCWSRNLFLSTCAFTSGTTSGKSLLMLSIITVFIHVNSPSPLFLNFLFLKYRCKIYNYSTQYKNDKSEEVQTLKCCMHLSSPFKFYIQPVITTLISILIILADLYNCEVLSYVIS